MDTFTALGHQKCCGTMPRTHQLRHGTDSTYLKYIIHPGAGRLDVSEGHENYEACAILYVYSRVILLEATRDGVTLLPNAPDLGCFPIEALGLPLERSTPTDRSRVLLRPGDRFTIGPAVFELGVRRLPLQDWITDYVNLEPDDVAGHDSGQLRRIKSESEQTVDIAKTPRGKRSHDTVIQETPSRQPYDLVKSLARHAFEFSQGNQQESDTPTKNKALALICEKAYANQNRSQSIATLDTRPRPFASIGGVESNEADDTQESNIRHAEATLRSATSGVPDVSSVIAKTDTWKEGNLLHTGDVLVDERISIPEADPQMNVASCMLPTVNGEIRENVVSNTAHSIDNTRIQPTDETVETASTPEESSPLSTEPLRKLKRRRLNHVSAAKVHEGNAANEDALPDQGRRDTVEAISSGAQESMTATSAVHNGGQNSMHSTISVQPTTRVRDALNTSFSSSNHDNQRMLSSAESPTQSENCSMQRSQTRSREKEKTMRVFYASSTEVDTMSAVMNGLLRVGARKTQDIEDCDYLCVGKIKLKKTINLIMAISSGKTIVTDDWAKQSAAHKKLLGPADYSIYDLWDEGPWGISLNEAVDRGRQCLKPFADYAILISPSLKQSLGKAYGDYKRVAEHGGAVKVESRFPQTKDRHSNTLVVAMDEERTPEQFLQEGWRCYKRDLVTMSVLRSALDLESDEFVIRRPDDEEADMAPRQRKRKR